MFLVVCHLQKFFVSPYPTPHPYFFNFSSSVLYPVALKIFFLCLHLFSFLSFFIFFLSILYSINFKFCFYGYFCPVHCLYFLILSCLYCTLLLLQISFCICFYEASYPYFLILPCVMYPVAF